MGRRKKIGHVKRGKGTFVWVDAHGDVWEMGPPKRKRRKR
jgi:arginase family enzyme